MDLQNLDIPQLRQLLLDVQTEMKTREQEELQKARDEIRSIAERVGLPLDALMSVSAKAKKQPTKVSAQYRNPDDASAQWTGRGRQPKWVKDFIEAGGTLDQLRIAQA